MENSLRLFLSLADPAQAGSKRECPFASPSPSPETNTSFPHSPPPTPYAFLSNYATAPPSEDLLQKPRPPPPRPIPLEFPQYEPKASLRPLTKRSMRDFRRAILSARRPADNTDAFFDLLNVQLTSDVSIESLLPEDFLPSRPYLYDTDLDSMLAELSIDNEDAFREVLRQKPKEGRTKPRIAYSRNFFGTLEDMSRYYDASKDNYFDEEVTDDDTDGGEDDQPASKDPRVDAQGDTEMSSPRPSSSNDSDPFPPAPTTSTATTTSTTPSSKPPTTSSSSPTKKRTKLIPRYTGLRLSSSAYLPPSTRTSLVRNLLKMALHKFTCRDYDLARTEKLRVRDVNVPPGLAGQPTFVVARLPADRVLARGRFVEGPVMGVRVGWEVRFRFATGGGEEDGERKDGKEGGGAANGNGNGNGNEAGNANGNGNGAGDIPLGPKVDLLREVGSLLAVAVMRGREGRDKDAETKRLMQEWWWTREKRWGGGETRWGLLANEVFEEEDPSWSPVERELQRQKREASEREMKRVEEAAKGQGGSEKGIDVAMGMGVGAGLSVQDLLAKSEEMAQPENKEKTGGVTVAAGAEAKAENEVQADPKVALLSENSANIPTLTPTLPKQEAPTSSNNAGSEGSSDAIEPESASSNNTNDNQSSPPHDRPPKKKHRLADRIPSHLLSSASSIFSSSSSSSSSNPSPATSSPSSISNNKPPTSSSFSSPATAATTDRLARDRKRERDMQERAEYREGRRLMYVAPMRRKWFREWANVRPGPSAGPQGWDEKVIWRRIGAPVVEPAAGGERGGVMGGGGEGGDVGGKGKEGKEREWDEVFQLSCLNHHVALVKMRVSRRYLRWLENGDGEAERPVLMGTTRPWRGADREKGVGRGKEGDVDERDVLRVERTRYYDLFSIEERKEFFVALWRVMSWLCRDEVPKVEWQRVEEARKAARVKGEEGEEDAGQTGNGQGGGDKMEGVTA